MFTGSLLQMLEANSRWQCAGAQQQPPLCSACLRVAWLDVVYQTNPGFSSFHCTAPLFSGPGFKGGPTTRDTSCGHFAPHKGLCSAPRLPKLGHSSQTWELHSHVLLTSALLPPSPLFPAVLAKQSSAFIPRLLLQAASPA